MGGAEINGRSSTHGTALALGTGGGSKDNGFVGSFIGFLPEHTAGTKSCRQWLLLIDNVEFLFTSDGFAVEPCGDFVEKRSTGSRL
jgi:hypothetical protein